MFASERKSLDRPAWTSEQKTGNLEAYKHKHTVEGGRFKLVKNFFGGIRNGT
jgi:hypothetical protein